MPSLNCPKFTEATGNSRVKQREAEERSTTALVLALAQANDDDDDDDREMPNQDAEWKSDSENITAVLSPSSTLSTTLIDRYEKLIENFNNGKVYDKSENYASIIIVTLLRQSPHMVVRFSF